MGVGAEDRGVDAFVLSHVLPGCLAQGISRRFVVSVRFAGWLESSHRSLKIVDPGVPSLWGRCRRGSSDTESIAGTGGLS